MNEISPLHGISGTLIWPHFLFKLQAWLISTLTGKEIPEGSFAIPDHFPKGISATLDCVGESVGAEVEGDEVDDGLYIVVNIVIMPPIIATTIALIAVQASLLKPCCFPNSFSGSFMEYLLFLREAPELICKLVQSYDKCSED
jgi:hypothetical protein